MGNERIISQIGDSTDEEDMPEETNADKNGFVNRMNKYYSDPVTTVEEGELKFNVSVSCILKELGRIILQNQTVKEEYKKIKRHFIPVDRKEEFYNLDSKIGRGWKILVKDYFPSRDSNRRQECLKKYYDMNKERIDNNYKEKDYYQQLENDDQKGEYHLKNLKLDCENKEGRDNVYKKNKDMEQFHDTLRYRTKMIQKDGSVKTNAAPFLARLKGSVKLDRDIAKNRLEDMRNGTISGGKDEIEKKYTCEKKLVIYESGKFNNRIDVRGFLHDYEHIAKRINEEFLNVFTSYDNAAEINAKAFFKSVLRGDYNRIHKLISSLEVYVENILRTDVKLNPAAMLTTAMYFDLLEGKDGRSILNMHKELPVALKGHVEASTYVDKIMELVTGRNYLPDYRTSTLENNWLDDKENPKHEIKISSKRLTHRLVTRDEKILKDWLEHIETIAIYKSEIKSNEKKTEYEVSGKVFDDLIFDWYGITIPELKNSDIPIKISFSTQGSDSDPNSN